MRVRSEGAERPVGARHLGGCTANSHRETLTSGSDTPSSRKRRRHFHSFSKASEKDQKRPVHASAGPLKGKPGLRGSPYTRSWPAAGHSARQPRVTGQVGRQTGEHFLVLASGREASGAPAPSALGEGGRVQGQGEGLCNRSSLLTKKRHPFKTNELPQTRKTERILGESARANVTFPVARSTSWRLCLVSSVPPSRT